MASRCPCQLKPNRQMVCNSAKVHACLQCTLASNAHLPPMHTCLQCTPVSSAHLPRVYTCLQSTLASGIHLPPVHTCIQCTPASSAHLSPNPCLSPLHMCFQGTPSTHLTSNHTCFNTRLPPARHKQVLRLLS